MGIKRNEVEEPRWDDMDYPIRSDKDLFFPKRWRKTVDWNIILKQVERTRQASRMIDISIYPSTLFFTALDLLEANLYVIDDMFYYLTGMRMIGAKPRSEKVKLKLGFWNMDCYKVLKQIGEELHQTRDSLTECLKHESIWDVSLKLLEKSPLYHLSIGDSPIELRLTTVEDCANIYACEHYEVDEIDIEALANQMDHILELIGHYSYFFFCIYGDPFEFPQLLALFCKSERAQKEYIEPWRKDFGGTRDSLIAKMEKDPKLGPWVNRYDHLPKDRNVFYQLFYDEKTYTGPNDEETCYNTDTWLSILTIAAVLQEYDEQKNKPVQNAENLVEKLSLYFKDEETTERFLRKIEGMSNRDVIIRVKQFYDAGLCFEKSKFLWKILYDANLYKAKFSNWNAQMNKL